MLTMMILIKKVMNFLATLVKAIIQKIAFNNNNNNNKKSNENFCFLCYLPFL